MKKTTFKETTGVIVVPILHLNFGQTVDVIDETSVTEQMFVITPHGETELLSVPKSCVQLYDTIYDSPCILNPRFFHENS
jgi:hypothetical protein